MQCAVEKCQQKFCILKRDLPAMNMIILGKLRSLNISNVNANKKFIQIFIKARILVESSYKKLDVLTLISITDH